MFGGSPIPATMGLYRGSWPWSGVAASSELVASANGRIALDVTVPDPECGYLVHRLGADLLTASEPDIQAS